MSHRFSVCLVIIGTLVWTSNSRALTQQEKISEPAIEVVKVADDEPAKSEASVSAADKKDSTEFEATHKQFKVFKPTHEDKPIKLNTFCVDEQGNILACVGGTSFSYEIESKEESDGDTDDDQEVANPYVRKKVDQPAYIKFYSPEFELVRQIPLDFTPTAINLDKSGNIFVAGDGIVAKLSNEGRILKKSKAPNAKDEAELRDAIEKQLIKQQEQQQKVYKQQVELIQKKIDKIKEKEESERTKAETRRLAKYELQIKPLQEMAEQMASFFKVTDQRVKEMIDSSKEIKSIAVNDSDVYVTCAAAGTYGYEIWRVDHQLENPARVLENVSGCCGQMDIQASGKHLFVAENTKFRVAVYDRDGELVDSFGSRARKGQEGFGSCCNPMNIRCCDNGEVLTAESSIGHIKRFNTDGELVGYIGKAIIGGGCKHVAMGHDKVNDRYYMMYEDESAICVLGPAALVGETEDEKLAKIAREGLGKKLLGKWEVADSKDETKEQSKPSVGLNLTVKAANFETDSVKLRMNQQVYESILGNSWRAIKQEDNKLWIAFVAQDVENCKACITFEEDDTIQMEVDFSGTKFPSTLKRIEK